MLKSHYDHDNQAGIRSRVLLHYGPAFKYVLIFQPDKLSYLSVMRQLRLDTRQISLLSGKGFSERKDGKRAQCRRVRDNANLIDRA